MIKTSSEKKILKIVKLNVFGLFFLSDSIILSFHHGPLLLYGISYWVNGVNWNRSRKKMVIPKSILIRINIFLIKLCVFEAY